MFIQKQLYERNWNKTDLALALHSEAAGRLTADSAERLVLRVTAEGTSPSPANAQLLATVLGGSPEEEAAGQRDELLRRLEAVEKELAAERRRFDRFVRATTGRLAALEEAQATPAPRSARQPKGGAAR